MDNFNKEKVLFVDDSTTVRKTAIKMLAERYDVIEAVNGEDAWRILQHENEIGIIFADIQMPVLNGLQLLSRIKKSGDESLTSLPVIMVTGESDTEATMRAVFEMGATDFIAKPFKAIDLQTRAYSYLKLTQKLKILSQQQGIDHQTGLCNATEFRKRGEQALSFAMRHKIEMTVACLEINDYQKIRQVHGENIATQILTTIAGRLEATLRKEDIIARTGIARFALVLPCTSQVKSSTIIVRMCQMIHNVAFDTGQETLHIRLTTGIASSAGNSWHSGFDELSLQAEQELMAAYSRKEDGSTSSRHENNSKVKKTAPDQIEHDELLQSFMHMMAGNFSKVDTTLHSRILDRFNAFSCFLEEAENTGKEIRLNENAGY